MAKSILAVRPLLSNDIDILASLFELSFDYYIKHNSPFYSDYLKALRTVAGLGFAAVLADRTLVSLYQPTLGLFLAKSVGDFKAEPHYKSAIAKATAEMVATAAMAFSALKCPRYYQEFFDALRFTIEKISILSEETSSEEKQQEVKRILDVLSVNS